MPTCSNARSFSNISRPSGVDALRVAARGDRDVSIRERLRASAGQRLRPAQSCGLYFSVFCLLFADEGMCGIYLRRLRGARFARAAEDNAASRRSYLDSDELHDSKEPQNTHASAHPAAEAISDEGRPRRRSVKNRRPFDCFKSAEGIRFSAGAVVDPEIVSPRRFLGYLLSAQKVT